VSGVKRLTPAVPGEAAPFLWLDGKVRTGFVSDGQVSSGSFPRWALECFGTKSHWFINLTGTDDKRSACGRLFAVPHMLFAPGNYPRCKACERIVSADLRRRAGL